jgi:hypothetical protein
MLNQSINGAKALLINVIGDEDIKMKEINEINTYLVSLADPNVRVFSGLGVDPTLANTGSLRVTVMATGLDFDESMPVTGSQTPEATTAIGALTQGQLAYDTVRTPGVVRQTEMPLVVQTQQVPKQMQVPQAQQMQMPQQLSMPQAQQMAHPQQMQLTQAQQLQLAQAQQMQFAQQQQYAQQQLAQQQNQLPMEQVAATQPVQQSPVSQGKILHIEGEDNLALLIDEGDFNIDFDYEEQQQQVAASAGYGQVVQPSKNYVPPSKRVVRVEPTVVDRLPKVK